jgi:CheY-like chemotaxis protein
VRSPQVKHHVPPDPGADTRDGEAFDSFGPVSDIWRALHPAKASADRQLLQTPYERTRILLAEPDAVHRRILRILLSSPNISLIEVEDGQAAVDLLALRGFDLMLLDVDMPRLSGPDTLRWVRRSHTPWCDIPIVGLIDANHVGMAGRLLSAGMTDWIGKPVSRNDLADVLRRVLPALGDIGA